MASIEYLVGSGFRHFFFPKQTNFQKNESNEIVLEAFKKKYAYEKVKSLCIKSAFYLSGAAAVGGSFYHGFFSTATVVSTVASGILTYQWCACANRPYDLALSAYHSIARGDEKEALDVIKAGANIYQDFSHLSIKSGANPNLYVQAAAYGCMKIINFLASLGWDLNENASALGRAPNLETVQLLVELGAKVNLYNGKQSSPLWIQLGRLSGYLDNVQDIDVTTLEEIRKKCCIIDLLLSLGAKLQSLPPRFDEKKLSITLREKDLKKIDFLSVCGNKQAEEIKNWVMQIYNRL